MEASTFWNPKGLSRPVMVLFFHKVDGHKLRIIFHGDNKLHNYLKITGILNNVFRPQKTLNKTRIKLYNTLALSVLLYGSETWTIKAGDARRITAAEMKYMRRTAGHIWTDYKTNVQIEKKLKITPVLDKLLEYKRNWIKRVNRMPRNGVPRVMKRYSPTGRRIMANL
jgi:hypothetical protein